MLFTRGLKLINILQPVVLYFAKDFLVLSKIKDSCCVVPDTGLFLLQYDTSKLRLLPANRGSLGSRDYSLSLSLCSATFCYQLLFDSEVKLLLHIR